MNLIDGRAIGNRMLMHADVAVVGSGPAGAAAALACAEAGARVVVVEAGRAFQPSEFLPDSFGAMAQLYRDMGASVMLGKAPMPYLQGMAVGGTSVINGAISWRLPRDVYDSWVAADPRLAEAWPWTAIEQATDRMESLLGIAPTDPAIAGPKNRLMALAAESLGLEHRPISRNAVACQGSGRCLQGCPHGAKQSVDRAILPLACRHGVIILASAEVTEIMRDGRKLLGVSGETTGGGAFEVRAPKVILAASAIQTPALLWRNGLRRGPVGDGLQCHPGTAVAGFFREPVRMWQGATQGHEVIGLRREGLKFEVLGFDYTILATRLPGLGPNWHRHLERMAHYADWGAAIKAQARGRVRPLGRKGVRVHYDLLPADVAKLRRGVQVLAELLFAAGAEQVAPGVHGLPPIVDRVGAFADFAAAGPSDPRAFHTAATHLFGTCRAGSDPAQSVVGLDFQSRELAGLFVADSSVFPSNTGVNPQTSILALATLCGRSVMAA